MNPSDFPALGKKLPPLPPQSSDSRDPAKSEEIRQRAKEFRIKIDDICDKQFRRLNKTMSHKDSIDQTPKERKRLREEILSNRKLIDDISQEFKELRQDMEKNSSPKKFTYAQAFFADFDVELGHLITQVNRTINLQIDLEKRTK